MSPMGIYSHYCLAYMQILRTVTSAVFGPGLPRLRRRASLTSRKKQSLTADLLAQAKPSLSEARQILA